MTSASIQGHQGKTRVKELGSSGATHDHSFAHVHVDSFHANGRQRGDLRPKSVRLEEGQPFKMLSAGAPLETAPSARPCACLECFPPFFLGPMPRREAHCAVLSNQQTRRTRISKGFASECNFLKQAGRHSTAESLSLTQSLWVWRPLLHHVMPACGAPHCRTRWQRKRSTKASLLVLCNHSHEQVALNLWHPPRPLVTMTRRASSRTPLPPGRASSGSPSRFGSFRGERKLVPSVDLCTPQWTTQTFLT